MFELCLPSREGKIPLYLLQKMSGVKYNVVMTPSIANARNLCFHKAYRSQKHVIMLDDDIEPVLSLNEITDIAEEHFKEGYDVVCGFYWLKTNLGVSVGVKGDKAPLFGLLPSNEVVWFPSVTMKPTPVDVCGTGFVIVNNDFIKRTYGSTWFDFKVLDYDKMKVMGEDVYFFTTWKPKTIADPRLVAYHHLSGTLAFDWRGILVQRGELDV